jgi:hypothetical protein
MAVRNFDYGITLHGDLTVPSHDIILGGNILLDNSTGAITATSFAGNGSALTNLSYANMAGVLLLDGTRAMTGGLQINGGVLAMGNATANRIVFSVNGSAAPNGTNNSAGQKITLWNDANTWGIGIEGSAVWYSSYSSHKWYSQNTVGVATPTNIMTLDGVGNLTLVGNITATSKLLTIGTVNATTALQVNGANISTIYTPQTRNVIAGTGLAGGGTMAADRTLSVSFGTTSTTVAAGDHSHDYQQWKLTDNDRAITVTNSGDWNDYTSTGFFMGSGLANQTSGGSWRFMMGIKHNDLYNSQTMWDFNAGTMGFRGKSNGTWTNWRMLWHDGNFDPATKVGTTRSIIAGTGLTGGGDLSADRTLSVSFGTTSTTAAAGNHTHTSFATGLAVTGTLNIGNNGNVGVISLKDSGGNQVIRLDGVRVGSVPSVPNITMDGDGNATFKGTVSVGLLQSLSSVRVDSLNAQFLDGRAYTAFAGTESMFDIHGAGVISGINVIETAVPSASIRVSAGIMYTASGRRIAFTGGEQKAIAAPSATFYRYDMVFIYGPSSGTSEGTLGIVAGSATSNTQAGAVAPTRAASGVAPTTFQYPYDAVLLARLSIKPLGQYSGGNATVLNADADNSFKEWRPILFNGLDFKIGGTDTVNLTVNGTISEAGKLLTTKYSQIGTLTVPVNNTFYGRQTIQSSGNVGGSPNGGNHYLKITDGTNSMSFDVNEISTNSDFYLQTGGNRLYLNTGAVSVTSTGHFRAENNATIAIFAIGEVKKRWTHNFGTTTYSILLGVNSFQRHVRWMNKTATYVDIELDNPATEEVQVDIALIGRNGTWGIS